MRQKTHRSATQFTLQCNYRRTAVQIYLHRSVNFTSEKRKIINTKAQ